MRKTTTVISSILIPFLCVNIVLAATKPSNPKKTDVRLSKPVTIRCCHSRLHVVIYEISRSTGVKINLGKDESDWRVRDIPVVVCTKKLPLGKLLQGIADAAHLTLSSQNVNGVPQYQLFRSNEQEEQIKSYVDAEKADTRALLEWQWDTLVRIKDLKSSDLDTRIPSEARAVSEIVASLAPDVRQRVLNGDQILLSGNNMLDSAWETIAWLAKVSRTKANPINGETKVDEEPAGERSGSIISVYRSMNILGCETGIAIAQNVESEESQLVFWEQSGKSLINQTRKAGFDITEWKSNLTLPADNFAKRYAELSADIPFLKAEVTLTQPQTANVPYLSDLLAALSDTGKVSVICEDFESQKTFTRGLPIREHYYGQPLSIYSILTKDEKDSYRDWRVDPKAKLVIGQSTKWVDDHQWLVPESLIKDIKSKLDGSGLELDDLSPISALTYPQRYEWIDNSAVLKELAGSSWMWNDDSLWLIYFGLDTSARAKAASEEGLPLSELDPVWIKARLKAIADSSNKTSFGESQMDFDSRDLSQLRLKVSSTDTRGKRRYSISIGEYHGDGIIGADLPMLLPLCAEGSGGLR